MEETVVIVVDDDASLRLLCRVNLELEGCRVLEAASIAEAEEVLRRQRIDVALLDVNVGRERGLDLLPTLRELQPAARIYLLSGDSRVGESARTLVDGVISKPFALEELTSLVR